MKTKTTVKAGMNKTELVKAIAGNTEISSVIVSVETEITY